MSTQTEKIRKLTVYFGLSVLVHLLVLVSLGRFGNYNFAAPVTPLQAAMVDLAKSGADAAPAMDTDNRKTVQTDSVAEGAIDDGTHDQAQGGEVSTPPAAPE
ncbi:MAG TPA: hypothetical protein VN642_01835, partial [Dongiaceae bacterium]|nr:hypothetical protein [Dongiaceae bacterium]